VPNNPSTSLRAQRSNPVATQTKLDCFVARAPRNDVESSAPTSPRHCERSEAIQGHKQSWIASLQGLLAMTELNVLPDI
jgi:hypothetical protein